MGLRGGLCCLSLGAREIPVTGTAGKNIYICARALVSGLTIGSAEQFGKVQETWYFEAGFNQTMGVQAQNILTFFVLLNSIIPLSLVVSMELAVLFQALFMMWDDDMRSEERGG